MDVGPTSGHIYAVVRANNLTIGADAAKYICNSAGGAKATGTAAVLQGDLASLNGLDRSNGFIGEMGKVCPEVHVVTYPTLWDSATAVSDATEALNTYSDLKGIYSSFSGPDDGIINAIKAAGKSATVPLVATDGVPAEMALIRQGSLAAAVSQPVNLYAEEGLAYAKLAAQGKPKPKLGSKGLGGGQIVNLNGSPEDALPSIFVTKSNVNAKALVGQHLYRPVGTAEPLSEKVDLLAEQSASEAGRAANSRPPVAEAQGISKSFGPTAALTDVSLTVVDGECHALVGRNGAGKSTLVAALTGLLKPTAAKSCSAATRRRRWWTVRPGRRASPASTSTRRSSRP